MKRNVIEVCNNSDNYVLFTAEKTREEILADNDCVDDYEYNALIDSLVRELKSRLYEV